MMAMTTNSSISVKARRAFWDLKSCKPFATNQPAFPIANKNPTDLLNPQ
jgi:hypothetical protein